MAQTHTIEITKREYPKTTVATGDTVTWVNKMNMPHTVTADDGGFDSGPFGKDKSFSQKFDTAGEFPYHCEIHGEMQGKVIVS